MIRPITAALSIILTALSQNNSYSSPDSVVVFNEIHYNPAGPEESTEWIELFNQMGIMTDVSGWRLDGIEYTIPENTFIEPGDYLVIAKDPGPGQIGPFLGNINNGGETLRLYNKGNRLMDELSFSDGGRWPSAADGSGTTLAKVLPYTANKPPENWTRSAQIGGTPGRTNFPSNGAEIPTKKIKLIELDDEWRYNESGNDLGSSWSEQKHALDQEWKSGKGGIGFESGATIPLETRLNFPSRNDPYVITYYFEREFSLRADQLSNLDSLIIRHAIDDGALIHINGKEVLRVNMPDGNITYSDLASENIEVDELSTEISVDTSGIVAGNNRISVEVHQSRIGNSDPTDVDHSVSPPNIRSFWSTSSEAATSIESKENRFQTAKEKSTARQQACVRPPTKRSISVRKHGANAVWNFDRSRDRSRDRPRQILATAGLAWVGYL